MEENISADLEKKLEGLERKEGLGQEEKEKDTRTLLEQTELEFL